MLLPPVGLKRRAVPGWLASRDIDAAPVLSVGGFTTAAQPSRATERRSITNSHNIKRKDISMHHESAIELDALKMAAAPLRRFHCPKYQPLSSAVSTRAIQVPQPQWISRPLIK